MRRWHTRATRCATLLGLLATAALARAQDYCVLGHFNGWVSDTACHLDLQADGTYEKQLDVAAQSGLDWTAYKIVDLAASPTVWHGALWSSDGGNKILVFPGVDGSGQVIFYLDPRDRSSDGWTPVTVSTGDSWNATHKMDGNVIDDTTAFWLVRGDFEVSAGTSYFSGVGCTTNDMDCAALTMTDSVGQTDGVRWDETPGDGIYSFGLVVPQDLASKTVHWNVVTNTSDGNVSTQLGPLGWVFAQGTPGTLDVGTVASILPAGTRGQLLLLELDALYGRLRGRLLAPPKLLLTEVVVTPTGGEYVELYNPGDNAVALDDFYLSDSPDYARIAEGSLSMIASDFVARFPAGAAILPHSYQVVAIQTATAFRTAYPSAAYPTYALVDDASGHSPHLRGDAPADIGGSAGLTDDGELVVLFYWDQINDLVLDVDYLSYGDFTAGSIADKSGLSVESTQDADGVTSLFQDDSPSDTARHAVKPVLSRSVARLVYDEVGFDGSSHPQRTSCAPSGTYCNGLTGADETSEWTSLTWRMTDQPRPAAPDFVANGTLCTANAQCQSNNCRLTPGGLSYCVAAAFLCADDFGQGLGSGEGSCSTGQAYTCLGLDTFDVETCSDGLDCTTDGCALGVCVYAPNTGFCAIAGACHVDAALNPGNTCEVCASASDATAWSPAADGSACTDTTPDDCKAAACSSRACDQNYGDEAETTACSDGDACTTGDQCNASGSCVPGTDTCGEDAGPGADAAVAVDAATGSDAAGTIDAAAASDIGAAVDSTTVVDAATAPDTATEDSATLADAAVAADVAVNPDVAVVDAATTQDAATVDVTLVEDASAPPDTTVAADQASAADTPTADGNAPRINPNGGCGCSGTTTRQPAGLLALGLLALAWRRRR